MFVDGKLKEPEHDVVRISGGDDDATATKTVRGVMSKVEDGSYGKKVILRIESVQT